MSKLKSLFHTYVLSDRVTQATQVTKCENLDSRAPWPIYFVQRTSVALSLAEERLNVLNWNSIRRMKLLVLAKASTKWKFVSIPSHFNMFGCCFVLFLVWLTHSHSHLLLLFHFCPSEKLSGPSCRVSWLLSGTVKRPDTFQEGGRHCEFYSVYLVLLLYLPPGKSGDNRGPITQLLC